MKKLSHVNKKGEASMVDVSNKPDQVRIAKASGFIKLAAETIQLVKDNAIKKGDVLTVAEVAGIQAAKQTAILIPLCHNIPLSKVEVRCSIEEHGISVESMVKCVGKTGVEMEALTAVNVALLTIYDMCKAVDKGMIIGEVSLVEKVKMITKIPK
ncbi:cyclic pyranopterin monophosphate synthase MoaC [Bacteroidota bacterium]